jgi:predicted alpha/beta-hydrolase family hydrolase
VIAGLRERDLVAAPLVVGGRSAGARVACRTAAAVGADAVLCLAFPVHPPGKADDPSKSRQGELDAVELPTLVVQGSSDPFGMPTPGPNREVVTVAGNHGLKKDLDAVAAAVRTWLPGTVG